MSNEFYIGAGLIGIDSADIGTVGTNAFYMTAGLVAGEAAAGGAMNLSLLRKLKGISGSASGCFLPDENDAIERKRRTED